MEFVVVSDNGTAFTSAEFKEFMQQNGIRHVTSSPYHPASNGLAERHIQTFKSALKKDASDDIQQQLSRFLFHYRSTPHTTTGTSPAQLLMGRRLRTHLDLLRPSLDARVCSSQTRQKADHDQSSRERQFNIGDPVFVRDFGSSSRWTSGVIAAIRGPVSYTVQLDDDRLVRRHVDHVRTRTVQLAPQNDDDVDLPTMPVSFTQHSSPSLPTSELAIRRSTRNRRPPSRYSEHGLVPS
jgi:transposase InsO family protein